MFNPLTTPASTLTHLLSTGQTTTVDVIKTYLDQIDKYESTLNSFISLAPREKLLRTAEKLDDERQRVLIRGKLHGVPIVLKDVFTTCPEMGMDTTAGSRALVGAEAQGNCPIVQRLVDAGMVILGKTNLTEFAGMKTSAMMPGWSAVGGQTISPYVGPIVEGERLLGHSAPGGSSTGSAVAVAAGFAPLALGAETIGSIVTPASRAALYALKPTVGVQDTSGMYSLTDFFDSPGPMAKSAADVSLLAEVLLGRTFPDDDAGWEERPVGFLDPDAWKMDEAMCRHFEGTAEQMKHDYEAVIGMLRDAGCPVKYPVAIPGIASLAVDGKDAIMPIAFWDFKNLCIPRFLSAFRKVSVASLADIVKFNEDNRHKCLPAPFTNQEDLIKALAGTDTEEHISSLKKKFRAQAKEMLDRVFEAEKVKVIAASADSPLCIHAAAAGYPMATVPLGQLRYNGRPFGLCLLGRENDEETLLRFMKKYEATVGPRPIPDLDAIAARYKESVDGKSLQPLAGLKLRP